MKAFSVTILLFLAGCTAPPSSDEPDALTEETMPAQDPKNVTWYFHHTGGCFTGTAFLDTNNTEGDDTGCGEWDEDTFLGNKPLESYTSTEPSPAFPAGSLVNGEIGFLTTSFGVVTYRIQMYVGELMVGADEISVLAPVPILAYGVFRFQFDLATPIPANATLEVDFYAEADRVQEIIYDGVNVPFFTITRP